MVTNRNAVKADAEFLSANDDLDEHVMWSLMRERYWANTAEDPRRRDHRSAELLVADSVPWAAIESVVTRNVAAARVVRELIGGHRHVPAVIVRAGWYF